MKDIIDGMESFGQQISELRSRIDRLEKDIPHLKMNMGKKEGKNH
jgi:polyhydroxyalkanoate synthesis regulator phasin